MASYNGKFNMMTTQSLYADILTEDGHIYRLYEPGARENISFRGIEKRSHRDLFKRRGAAF